MFKLISFYELMIMECMYVMLHVFYAYLLNRVTLGCFNGSTLSMVATTRQIMFLPLSFDPCPWPSIVNLFKSTKMFHRNYMSLLPFAPKIKFSLFNPICVICPSHVI
jgi:hypothetical protein